MYKTIVVYYIIVEPLKSLSFLITILGITSNNNLSDLPWNKFNQAQIQIELNNFL